MKSAALLVVLGVVLVGCSTSKKRSTAPWIDHRSEFSTSTRLWRNDAAVEKRAESLERTGLSAKEAREYAEIEYLKSTAGSPLGR